MSTTPYNEAGITATFAAIFARLEELEHGQEDHHTRAATFAAIFARLDALEADVFAVHGYADHADVDALSARLERLESARIAPPVAPESAVTASGVPMEPGNATEAHSPELERILATAGEVAAALRMYRKVRQAEDMGDGEVRVTDDDWYATAAGFLAWLKEGEA